MRPKAIFFLLVWAFMIQGVPHLAMAQTENGESIFTLNLISGASQVSGGYSTKLTFGGEIIYQLDPYYGFGFHIIRENLDTPDATNTSLVTAQSELNYFFSGNSQSGTYVGARLGIALENIGLPNTATVFATGVHAGYNLGLGSGFVIGLETSFEYYLTPNFSSNPAIPMNGNSLAALNLDGHIGYHF